MLHPSPAGGSGELFPSPAKGQQDNPGLTDEQGAKAQALVNAALGGYYTRGETNNLLAGKEPSIAEGGLAQSKIQNLTSDLAAKASSQQLADAIATQEPTITKGSLSQSMVTGLVSALASKASTGALATVSANLTQAIVTSQTTLEEELDNKASTQELVQAVATREPVIAEGSLAQSKIQNLTSDLAVKASSQQLADGLAAK